jgi:hypothetical protein
MDTSRYPFNLRVFYRGIDLGFHSNVTFFVGGLWTRMQNWIALPASNAPGAAPGQTEREDYRRQPGIISQIT